ncbi:hypothetical protein M444_02850 [Streptomyces sp. Mg1]|nr:hypothetical protein M444_02850 [Streptomyces sp. Mg1]
MGGFGGSGGKGGPYGEEAYAPAGADGTTPAGGKGGTGGNIQTSELHCEHKWPPVESRAAPEQAPRAIAEAPEVSAATEGTVVPRPMTRTERPAATARRARTARPDTTAP